MEPTNLHSVKSCQITSDFWRNGFDNASCLLNSLKKRAGALKKLGTEHGVNDFFTSIRKHEDYWRHQLEHLEGGINLPFEPITATKAKISSNRSPYVKLAHKKFSSISCTTLTLLTALLVYLYRFNNHKPYTVAYGNAFLNNLPIELKSLFSEYVPLTISFDSNYSFNTASTIINKQLLELQNNKTFAHELLKNNPDLHLENRFTTTFSINTLNSIADYSPLFRTDIAVVITDNLEIYIYGNRKVLVGNNILTTACENIIPHVENILEAVPQNEHQFIRDLPLLTAKEYQQIVIDWNATETSCPLHKTLPELFEEQVAKTPNNTAVVFKGQSLTYRELNTKVNQIAHYLRELGVKPNTLVALCIEKSLDMLIGMLGIIKAGSAYIPLDPTYPENRLQFMLEDSQAQIILTQKSLLEQLSFLSKNKKQVICLDTKQDDIKRCSATNPSTINNSEDLVYVIYTSGSTGTPKGSLIKHSGVINLAQFLQRDGFDIKTASRITQISSICFDASVLEIWPTLLSGSALYIIPEDIRKDCVALYQFLTQFAIEKAFLPPAVLKNFPHKPIKSLSTLMIGGDVCDEDTKKFWSNNTRLVNAYGPTEATVCVTVKICSSQQKKTTIGKPGANNKIYILDKYSQPVPIGAIGEIYIGGCGVGKGYLNRPELNQEKFIQNPFVNKTLLYKTGDLGRWLPNGDIDFIGRMDNQVKIRGFRIELEEINNQLQKYPDIKQSVVLAKKNDNGNIIIIAYSVCYDKNTFDVARCKNHLKNLLPDYMIPAAFVTLDSLPLNSSGKIDKITLLALKDELMLRSTPYTPATTANEKTLVTIWSKILDLKSNQISTQDNFFDIGGDSLTAAHIISKINSHFKINLTIGELFKHATINSLAKKIAATCQDKSTALVIKPDENRLNYPLSYPQELIYIHQLTAPNIPLYNESMVININSNLNIKALENSINEIVKRHEILRTNITISNSLPQQIIRPFKPVNVSYVDLSVLDKNKREKRALTLGTKSLKKIFNLEQDLLIRFILIKLETNRYQLFIIAHHIIIDGISIFKVLGKELATLYKTFSSNKQPSLPPLKIQYKDYSIWQRDLDANTKITTSLAYWTKQLAKLQPLQLPTKQPNTKNNSFHGKRQHFSISKELMHQLEKISKQENVTLFMTIFTAFNILLYRYTNQQDIAIGTAVAGRNNIAIEKLIGNFLNTLILRNKISTTSTIQQLLQEIKSSTVEAYTHQDLPFQVLLKNINLPRNSGNNLPFQVAFIYEVTPEAISSTWNIKQSEIHSGTAKFGLMFGLENNSQGIVGQVEYNPDLYEDKFISQLILHFQTLLQNLPENLYKPVNQVSILPPQELNKILNCWNQTEHNYPAATIHELFEKQVIKNPNKIAVTFQQQKLSYKELNTKANKLAHYLQKLGVKPDTLISFCFNRSIEAVIGILGILKANAAYVPIDANYPQVRIKDILDDSQTPILLTDTATYTSSNLEEITNHTLTTIFLDKDWQKIEQEDSSNIPSVMDQNNLAYVIYTSGSTGKPKGILLPHKTITNLISWQITTDHSYLKQPQNIAQFASFSFDVSLQETFCALLNGHKLHIIPAETKKSITKLIAFLQHKKINKLFLPPSVLGLLIHEAIACNFQLPHLNEIIVASSTLIINQEMRRFFTHNKHTRLVNHYGPSETHVVTAFTLSSQPDQWAPLPPIGKPIANTKAYILNAELQPVPINVPGELYLGGEGLARCYLNRPDLTKEKFIPNPFSKDKNEKIYKTGDLARWLPDGNIAFIERIDNQVKIRGFRVELDEIEHRLLQHESIHQCVVKTDADQYGTKRLIAYIVYKDKNRTPLSNIKQHLKTNLPEYMIPAVFITLDTLPLNNNGKVDAAALPKPLTNGNNNELNQDKPITVEEKMLAEIWANILTLNINVITTADSFFELGGHSLSSLQLLTEIKKAFAIDLEPHELFNAPTITDIITTIQQKKSLTNNKSPKNTNDNSPHIILLKKGTSNTLPIFLIHPIGGTVFWYKTLTQHLNCNNPIYGIQDPSINSNDKIFNTLKEMASFYLTLIKKIQPQGPYLLGGASFGGTVAIEIAQQLSLQGDEINQIILFDSWAVYPDDVKERKIFADGLRHMHASLVAKSTMKGLSNIKSWLDLQWHRAQLLWSYPIPSILQKITLFKAKNPVPFFTLQDHPSNYWQDYTSTKVTTYIVPGDHESIFQPPNVKILANRLEKVINKILFRTELR